MIVTCERCETQFQLDDSRVPASGARVRCSRCKHAFMIRPRADSEAEQIEQAAAQALAAQETPEVTRDLPDEDETLPFDDEESDWEFNDELPIPSPPAAASPASAAPPPAAPPVHGARELDSSAGDSSLELANVPEHAEPEPHASVDLSDEGPSDELEVGLEMSAAPAEDLGAPTPASADEASEPSHAGPEAPRPQRDELGTPSEWDIFDEEAADVATDAALDKAEEAVVAEAAASLRVSVDDAPEALDEAVAGAWLRHIGAAAGWVATLCLCVLGLSRGLLPVAPAHAALPAPAPGLEIEGLRVRWLDNAQLGPIYVVSGALRNTGPQVTPMKGLALVLRDASGREVGRPVPLTPPRSPEQLREGGIDALRATGSPALERALIPKGSRPFEAVVLRMPVRAARFEILAVGP